MIINQMLYETFFMLGYHNAEYSIFNETNEYIVDGNIDINDFSNFLKDKYKKKLLSKIRKIKNDKNVYNSIPNLAKDELLELENKIKDETFFIHVSRICYIEGRFYLNIAASLDFVLNNGNIGTSQIIAILLFLYHYYDDKIDENKKPKDQRINTVEKLENSLKYIGRLPK